MYKHYFDNPVTLPHVIKTITNPPITRELKYIKTNLKALIKPDPNDDNFITLPNGDYYVAESATNGFHIILLGEMSVDSILDEILTGIRDPWFIKHITTNPNVYSEIDIAIYTDPELNEYCVALNAAKDHHGIRLYFKKGKGIRPFTKIIRFEVDEPITIMGLMNE